MATYRETTNALDAAIREYIAFMVSQTDDAVQAIRDAVDDIESMVELASREMQREHLD